MRPIEIFKQVEGSSAYYVSQYGRIVSTNFRNKRRISLLRLRTGTRGYLVCNLSRRGQTHIKKIHRLVYHHFVARISSRECLDHIDGDKLNNSLSNLRIATHQQNMRNAGSRRGSGSEFKGVSFCKMTRRWRAQCVRYIDGRRVSHVGRYETEEQAARAYDEVAREFYGEFARLNFNSPS